MYRFPEEGIKPACVEISYHFGNSDKDVGSVANAIQDTCVGHSLIPLVPRRIHSMFKEMWCSIMCILFLYKLDDVCTYGV